MELETATKKILDAIPWRCFHCDFITMDRAEAAAHFGDEGNAIELNPICKWWTELTEDKRVETLQNTLRQLSAEMVANARLSIKLEGLEHQVDSQESIIKSYKPFRNCRSIYDVFCVYDSMEGRALAVEERLKNETTNQS